MFAEETKQAEAADKQIDALNHDLIMSLSTFAQMRADIRNGIEKSIAEAGCDIAARIMAGSSLQRGMCYGI